MASRDIDEIEELELPAKFTHLPIRALRVTSRRKVAQFLDLDGNLIVCEVQGQLGDDELDLVNNYNGLAELVGFGYLEIQNMMRCKSPTEELLHMWTKTAANGGTIVQATVGNLWRFLYMMERIDVLTDCRRAILNDCRLYEDQQQMQIEAERYRFEKMEQDPTVTNSEMQVDEFKYACKDSVKTGERQHYNAFISYCTEDDEDLQFVRQLIRHMETERGLKLFVPMRDDLPGSAYHVITAYLIEKMCDRVVLVMSDSFLKSEACDFQLKFAHSLAPGARSKKLIPIIRDRQTPIPRVLRFLAVCDFSKTDMLDWVLDRLFSAIIAPIGPITYFQDSDMTEYSTYRKDFEESIYPKPRQNRSLFSSSSVSSTMDECNTESSGFASATSTNNTASSSASSSYTDIYQRTSQRPSSNQTVPIVKNKDSKTSRSFPFFESFKRKSKRPSTQDGKKGDTNPNQSTVVQQSCVEEQCNLTSLNRPDQSITSNETIQMSNMSDINPESGITSSSAAEGFVKVDYIADPIFVPKGPPSIDPQGPTSMECEMAGVEPDSGSSTPKLKTKPVLPPKPNVDTIRNRGQSKSSNINKQAEQTIHFV